MTPEILRSPVLWLSLTIGIFLLIQNIQSLVPNKLVKSLFNPLLFTILFLISLLSWAKIPYENYQFGGQFLNLFIAPATVALAIKLEKNYHYLKKFFPAIIIGIISGVVIHTLLIFILAILTKVDSELIATLYPKSITTAIAVDVSESMGGIVSLTVAIVVVTGIIGSLIAEPIFNFFKINDPIAQGVSLGTAAHAMGTSKAIELGDLQGAMAGVSIVITGIVVVVLAPLVEWGILNLFE